MTETGSERLGWAASVVLHGLLVLIFIGTVMEIRPFALEFTAVSFSSAAAGQTGGAALPTFEGGRPLIELPRRPMLDETSPLLRLPERARQAVEAPMPQEKPEPVERETLGPRRRAELAAEPPGTRGRAEIQPMPLSDELLMGERADLLGERLSGDEMFSIEWEGLSRVKVSGSLPEFPPGLNRAATVRIAFEVAPDGSVAFATPLTKGLPELEKVSLEALRMWRFNPLERSMPRKNQKGVVTFIFRLE